MKIYSYDKGKEQVILAGYIKDAFFVKEVDPTIHFMYAEQGYGINEDVFEKIQTTRMIRVVTPEETREIPRYVWEAKDSIDYNNGPQKFVAWEDMVVVEP